MTDTVAYLEKLFSPSPWSPSDMTAVLSTLELCSAPTLETLLPAIAQANACLLAQGVDFKRFGPKAIAIVRQLFHATGPKLLLENQTLTHDGWSLIVAQFLYNEYTFPDWWTILATHPSCDIASIAQFFGVAGPIGLALARTKDPKLVYHPSIYPGILREIETTAYVEIAAVHRSSNAISWLAGLVSHLEDVPAADPALVGAAFSRGITAAMANWDQPEHKNTALGLFRDLQRHGLTKLLSATALAGFAFHLPLKHKGIVIPIIAGLKP